MLHASAEERENERRMHTPSTLVPEER
jgi:hypothetical protein